MKKLIPIVVIVLISVMIFFAIRPNKPPKQIIYSFEHEVPLEHPDIDQLKIQAENGNIEAQYNLGKNYALGTFIPKSVTKAVHWFRLAAEHGYAEAQSSLGYCYYNGEGVRQNYAEAVRWYRLAADQGYAEAQYNLGICYYNGQGLPQNYTEAVRWYRLAAEQGNANAQRNLGLCYKKGEGVNISNSEAYFWFILAAMDGTVEYAATNRDEAASLLSRTEREQVQARATRWYEQHLN